VVILFAATDFRPFMVANFAYICCIGHDSFAASLAGVFATVASLWLFYFDSCAHLCRSSLQRAAAPDFGGCNCYGCGETSASVEVN